VIHVNLTYPVQVCPPPVQGLLKLTSIAANMQLGFFTAVAVILATGALSAPGVHPTTGLLSATSILPGTGVLPAVPLAKADLNNRGEGMTQIVSWQCRSGDFKSISKCNRGNYVNISVCVDRCDCYNKPLETCEAYEYCTG
jgi:hypothetical protein